MPAREPAPDTPAAPDDAPPLIALLRDRTRPLHDRLEARVDIAARLRDADAYRALLLRFWGLYAALEPRLEASAAARLPADLLDALRLAERRKLPRLADDLSALGIDAAARDAAPVADAAHDLPDLPDAAAVLGALYVVEGSTLGGQVIARLTAAPDVPAAVASARAFFSGYGACTGVRWREYRAVLEAWGSAAPADRDRCARAAAETFAAFERWLTPPPAPLAAAGRGGRDPRTLSDTSPLLPSREEGRGGGSETGETAHV